MITLAQNDLGSEPKLLKRVAKDFALNFGVYASIFSQGTVNVDDSVQIF